MEIERKFLVKRLPKELEEYTHLELVQGYLCTSPVVRARREGEEYFLTYKSGGLMARQEYNMPLDEESFKHLIKKADGKIISKTRYLIPVEDIIHLDTPHDIKKITHEEVGDGRVCELDVFHGDYEGLVLAEIEFSSVEQANAFEMPELFSEDVTYSGKYHNSYMATKDI